MSGKSFSSRLSTLMMPLHGNLNCPTIRKRKTQPAASGFSRGAATWANKVEEPFMFDQSVPPAVGVKGTVPMTAFVKGKKSSQARPKGRIVGKDDPRQPYRDLCLLSDRRVLVAYRGRFIGSPFGLQVRAGPDPARVAELPGAARPVSLVGDGLLLASGPLAGGYESSVRVVNLTTRSILDTFPIRQPYLWLTGSAGRFVGQTPAFPSFEARPHVDPALIDRHPGLRQWAE